MHAGESIEPCLHGRIYICMSSIFESTPIRSINRQLIVWRVQPPRDSREFVQYLLLFYLNLSLFLLSMADIRLRLLFGKRWFAFSHLLREGVRRSKSI